MEEKTGAGKLNRKSTQRRLGDDQGPKSKQFAVGSQAVASILIIVIGWLLGSQAGGCKWHSNRRGLPHQGHVFRSESVRGVDQFREFTFERKNFHAGFAQGFNGFDMLPFEIGDLGRRELAFLRNDMPDCRCERINIQSAKVSKSASRLCDT